MRWKNEAAWWAGWVVALLVGGCSDNVKTRQTLPPGERMDIFDQVTVGKVDILWVIDNSGSTADKQANLARNFHAFFDYLTQAKVDYHLAVTTTDVQTDAPCGTPPNTAPCSKGQLYAAPGEPTVITPATPDPVAAFQKNVAVGTSGSGNEEGLEGARLALLLKPAGFLRSDAYLYLIFVSDDDDHSDPGEPKYFYRFFASEKGKGNEGMVSAGAIVGDVPKGCYEPNGGEARAGTRYVQVVDLMGGQVGSVCSTEFADALEQMGIDAVGLRRKFQLAKTPDVSSIQVTVKYPCGTAKVDPGCENKSSDCSGGATGGITCGIPELANAPDPQAQNAADGWLYEPSSNSVVFYGKSIPPKGSEIDVLYWEQGKKP